jgi:hypothetical protein
VVSIIAQAFLDRYLAWSFEGLGHDVGRSTRFAHFFPGI